MAPPVFGLRRLNTRYGKVFDHGQMLKLEALEAARPGTDDGLTEVSLVRSCEPAWMSASCVSADETPRVSTIEVGYWCRSVSVDCFQAGLCTNVIDLPATYELIAYGPSEIVCCPAGSSPARSCRTRPGGPRRTASPACR